jgi:hypothetical protein
LVVIAICENKIMGHEPINITESCRAIESEFCLLGRLALM